jgi:hypothetical protein
MWRGLLNCLDFKQLAHGLHVGLPISMVMVNRLQGLPSSA